MKEGPQGGSSCALGDVVLKDEEATEVAAEECHQTKEMKHLMPWTMFMRFLGSPAKMNLSNYEIEFMKKRFPNAGPMAQRVLCWRATVLLIGAIFHFAISVMKTIKLFKAVNRENHIVNDLPASGYEKFFKGMMWMEVVLKGLITVGSVVALIFVIAALIKVWSPRQSRYLVFCAFLASYTPSFLGFLLMPFSQGYDMNGLVKQVCSHAINGFEVDFTTEKKEEEAKLDSDSPTSGAMTALQPFIKRLEKGHGLKKELKQKTGIELSNDFESKLCNKHPNLWSMELESELKKHGVFTKEGEESCPEAKKMHTKLKGSLPACSSACPDECRPHKANSCVPSTLHKLSVMAREGYNMSMFKEQARDGSELKRCAKCVEAPARDECVGCLESLSTLKDTVCFSHKDFSIFNAVVEFAKHSDQYKIAFNLHFTMEAFEELLPDSISLVSGMILGGKVARLLMPADHMPGFLVGLSVVFTLPTLTCIFALATSTLGSVLTSLAFLFLLLSYLLFVPNIKFGEVGLMDATDFGLANQDIQRRSHLGLGFKLIFVVLLIAWAIQNGDEGIIEEFMTRNNIDNILHMLPQTIGNAVLSYLGKSRLTFLMYVDQLLYTAVSFAHLQAQTPEHLKTARQARIDDLKSIFVAGELATDLTKIVKVSSIMSRSNSSNSNKNSKEKNLESDIEKE